MDVTAVACLKDNYAYLLRPGPGPEVLVVDPSEAAPVLGALERAKLKLVGILNTHHHWDHVGGNEELVRELGAIPVFGHVSDKGRIPGQSHFLEHGSKFEAAGLEFDVMHIPGHTLGAVAYIASGCVFTGDTLFAAGCGRLFEGTPAMMYESLNSKLGSLPDETRVYFGHEYTQSNLKFAAHVEPSNSAIKQKADRVARARALGQPTTPSTMAEERLTNPFMRCDQSEIIQSVQANLAQDQSPAAVLGAVRAAKDAF